jgi:hypothetical protein
MDKKPKVFIGLLATSLCACFFMVSCFMDEKRGVPSGPYEPVPTIALSKQKGTIISGTSGTVIFTATTENIADGTSGSITWGNGTSGGAAAPSGISASVSAITAGAATVTMTVDASVPAGVYYFILVEGSVESEKGKLIVYGTGASKVALSKQSGYFPGGSSGYFSYSVTTTNVLDGIDGEFTWYADAAGSVAASAPAGVWPTVSSVRNNIAEVRISANSFPAGTYYFKLTEGLAISEAATLFVDAAGTPTISVSPQTVSINFDNIDIAHGVLDCQWFDITTTYVADGSMITMTFTDASGAQMAESSNGISVHKLYGSEDCVKNHNARVLIDVNSALAVGTYNAKAQVGNYGVSTTIPIAVAHK